MGCFDPAGDTRASTGQSDWSNTPLAQGQVKRSGRTGQNRDALQRLRPLPRPARCWVRQAICSHSSGHACERAASLCGSPPTLMSAERPQAALTALDMMHLRQWSS